MFSYAREIEDARKALATAQIQRDHIGARMAHDRLSKLRVDSRRANAEKLAVASVNQAARDHWINVAVGYNARYTRMCWKDKRLLLVKR